LIKDRKIEAMAAEPTAEETKQAQEYMRLLEAEFVRARFKSMAIAVLFMILGGLVAAVLPIISFCLFAIALIFLLRYFDVNGQLHEIRRRPTKTLFSRVWVRHSQGSSRSASEPGVAK
jgi:hypothetical protein